MASKYDKTIRTHGHRSLVCVVTGRLAESERDNEKYGENGLRVLGIFTSYDDARAHADGWTWDRSVDADGNCPDEKFFDVEITVHHIRFPLIKGKSAKAESESDQVGRNKVTEVQVLHPTERKESVK